jgi:hypothetical protein
MTTVNKFGAFQGDVAIIKLDELPEGAKPTNKRTVAYGEVTGHHHTVVGECDAYQLPNGLVFVVTNGQEAILTHQEHDPVTLSTGIWFCPTTSQVEYDGENERRVLD